VNMVFRFFINYFLFIILALLASRY